jgi:hypothetical protein
MYSLALDAYQLHSLTTELPCKVRSVAGLGFPDVRLDAYARAGTHGLTIAHNLYGGRLITLEGTIRQSATASYMANRRALEAAVGLQLDSNNVPVTRTLSLLDQDLNAWQIPVVTKSFQCDYESPGLTWGRWQLQLQAADYRIFSQTVSSVTLTLPQSDGFLFSPIFPITFGASSGGSSTAANTGNTAASPVVTITGPVTNPTVRNDATGEALGLTITLIAGDVLTIDMARRTVILGGSTNRMSAKTVGSTFWAIQPGNNDLRFSADTYNTGTATIAWRSAVLGL